MIYATDNDRSKSFLDRAKLQGIMMYAGWLQSIGDDIQQIRYVDRFDWTTEHLPPSIIPFLPAEPMTRDEADTFFGQFKTESREALARLQPPAFMIE
jgi:hypothetical protein